MCLFLTVLLSIPHNKLPYNYHSRNHYNQHIWNHNPHHNYHGNSNHCWRSCPEKIGHFWWRNCEKCHRNVRHIHNDWCYGTFARYVHYCKAVYLLFKGVHKIFHLWYSKDWEIYLIFWPLSLLKNGCRKDFFKKNYVGEKKNCLLLD